MRVETNIYYNPENSGMTIFDSIDTAGSYEFDIFLILKKLDDNSLYYTYDSGCSCPTPFEDVCEVDEITHATLYNFEQALENHNGLSREDFLKMLKAVRDHLDSRYGGVVNDAREFFEV